MTLSFCNVLTTVSASFRLHGIWLLHFKVYYSPIKCQVSKRASSHPHHQSLSCILWTNTQTREHQEAPFILEQSPVYWLLCCLKKFIAPSGKGTTAWCLLKSTSGSNLLNSNQLSPSPFLQSNNPQGPIIPHNCSFVRGLRCVFYVPNYRSEFINKFRHSK